MSRKFLGRTLVVLLMAAGLALGASPAQTADPGGPAVTEWSAPPAQESLKRPNCTPVVALKTSRTEPNVLSRWIDISTKINYRHCYLAVLKHRWVDPVSVEFYFNREGSSESCGVFDDFDGVRYDLYLKDGAGKNYHLPTVTLGCSKDTKNWTIRSLRGSPNYHYCFGVPRWKTNWTVRIDGWNDSAGSTDGNLWGFIGPVHNQCGG